MIVCLYDLWHVNLLQEIRKCVILIWGHEDCLVAQVCILSKRVVSPSELLAAAIFSKFGRGAFSFKKYFRNFS